jgi:ketosteroid isomerase-like protein
MSANVDLVRSIYAAWERGDYESAEWAHPEIECVVADGPDAGTWKGLGEMPGARRAWLGVWEGYRTEAEEFRDLEHERVLVLIRRAGRGKKSGLQLRQLETKGAGIFQLREGKVTSVVTYWDRDRALADLGLAPERDPPAS